MAKIFVVGDLHGNSYGEARFLNSKIFKEQKNLTKEDILFQLGDFGYLWYYKESREFFKKQLKRLNFDIAKRNFQTIVIPGNHENYDEIESLEVKEIFGAKCYVLELDSGIIYFAKRGEVFNIDGVRILVFGGAKSIDRESRKSIKEIDRSNFKEYKKVSWWERELPTFQEHQNALKNLAKYNNRVDFILTHTAPKPIVEKMSLEFDIDSQKILDPTTSYLEDIYKRADFREWHFGHFHINWSYRDDKNRYFSSHYALVPKLIYP